MFDRPAAFVLNVVVSVELSATCILYPVWCGLGKCVYVDVPERPSAPAIYS